jgi:hypothetical protein
MLFAYRAIAINLNIKTVHSQNCHRPDTFSDFTFSSTTNRLSLIVAIRALHLTFAAISGADALPSVSIAAMKQLSSYMSCCGMF